MAIAMQAQAYLYEHARDVVELLDGLGERANQLSLLMTDRTGSKEFSVEARAGSDIPLPLSDGAGQLARALHPLAALGGPGSGLVGAGAMLEYLHGAGLGSYRDLPTALAACAVSAEDVHAILQALLGGGVLVLTADEALPNVPRPARQIALHFSEHAAKAQAPVLAPAAPAVDQRAQLTPAMAPPGDATRNLEHR